MSTLSYAELFNIFGDVAYYIYPHYINSYIDDWRNEHKERFREVLNFIQQPTYSILIHNCNVPDILNFRFVLYHINIELYYSPRYPKYFDFFRLLLNCKPWASLSSITFENGLIFFCYEYFFNNRHIAFIKFEINNDYYFDPEYPPITNIILSIPSLRHLYKRIKYIFHIKNPN
jgi:hypothetical protein